jgi:uncharacterized membrane-anchored protein
MKTKLLFLVLGLQATWMVATVVVQETKLARSNSFLLETMVVDPRDYLRGDYVTLNYEISSIPVSVFSSAGTNLPPYGTPVYVRLEKHGQFYELQNASVEALPSDRDHPVLRGRTASRWFGRVNGGTNEIVRVEYGLERFYVAEGAGNPRGKLTVEAAVPDSGNAVIKQVYLNGEPYAKAMRGTDK